MEWMDRGPCFAVTIICFCPVALGTCGPVALGPCSCRPASALSPNPHTKLAQAQVSGASHPQVFQMFCVVRFLHGFCPQSLSMVAFTSLAAFQPRGLLTPCGLWGSLLAWLAVAVDLAILVNYGFLQSPKSKQPNRNYLCLAIA